MYSGSFISCGVGELTNIAYLGRSYDQMRTAQYQADYEAQYKQKLRMDQYEPVLYVKKLKDKCVNENIKKAYFVFSDIIRNESVPALKKAIESEGLGKVTIIGGQTNPNTDNPIEIGIWEVDKKAWAKYNQPMATKIKNAIADIVS